MYAKCIHNIYIYTNASKGNSRHTGWSSPARISWWTWTRFGLWWWPWRSSSWWKLWNLQTANEGQTFIIVDRGYRAQCIMLYKSRRPPKVWLLGPGCRSPGRTVWSRSWRTSVPWWRLWLACVFFNKKQTKRASNPWCWYCSPWWSVYKGEEVPRLQEVWSAPLVTCIITSSGVVAEGQWWSNDFVMGGRGLNNLPIIFIPSRILLRRETKCYNFPTGHCTFFKPLKCLTGV